mmetsp:Transcript_111880/g.209802  ORF Transcript_111880/g.209802 Transcript_111880/m.209802 type:complete len:208 (-) Transcript_111880:184-807(-)
MRWPASAVLAVTNLCSCASLNSSSVLSFSCRTLSKVLHLGNNNFLAFFRDFLWTRRSTSLPASEVWTPLSSELRLPLSELKAFFTAAKSAWERSDFLGAKVLGSDRLVRQDWSPSSSFASSSSSSSSSELLGISPSYVMAAPKSAEFDRISLRGTWRLLPASAGCSCWASLSRLSLLRVWSVLLLDLLGEILPSTSEADFPPMLAVA